MERRQFLGLGITSVLVGCGGVVSTSDDARSERSEDASSLEVSSQEAATEASVPTDAFDAGAQDGAEADTAVSIEGGTPVEASVPPVAIEMLPERAVSFPLGAWAGDATSSSALFATQYTGALPLGLIVVEVEGERAVRTVFDGAATVGSGGFVQVEVPGLRAGARHRYAFVERVEERAVTRGALGRLRAAPADDALEPVIFAGVSCTKQTYKPFPALAHAAARTDLDFTIHGGDHTYCDGARSLDDYRTKYRENWSDPNLQGWHQSAGAYNTWDDHEVDNNFNPETVDRTQFETARNVFFEHNPVRRDRMNPQRIWRSFRWGRTIELFVLDSRGERLPSTRRSNSPIYLSRAQMDWLKAGLQASTARFKLIVNSVPIANFPLVFDVGGANDRWEGYTAQRNELLDLITGRPVPGVLFLSGDFHLGCICKLENSGARSSLREVLMGPGGQFGNPGALTLVGSQWEYVTQTNNYTAFRVDPSAGTIVVQFFGTRGEMLTERTLRV